MRIPHPEPPRGLAATSCRCRGSFASAVRAGFGPGALGPRGISRAETHVCPGLLRVLEPRGSGGAGALSGPGPAGSTLVPALCSRGGSGKLWVPRQRASCREQGVGRRLWGSNLSAGQGGAAHSTRAADSEKQSKDTEQVPTAPETSPQHLKRGLRGAQLRLAGCCLLGGHQGAVRRRPASSRAASTVVPSPASRAQLWAAQVATRPVCIPPTDWKGDLGGPGLRTHTPRPSKGRSCQPLQECCKAAPTGALGLTVVNRFLPVAKRWLKKPVLPQAN